MGILSGVVSYLFGLALNLLDAAINGFLGALGFDLDTFETYFPAARDYHDVIIGFAVGLLFIMLIFQLFRNFGVVLDIEAEDSLKMLGKTALFYGMIINSRSITNMVIKLLADPYAIFINTASGPYEFKLMNLVTSMFTTVFSNTYMALVGLILMLVLGWQFLKLTIECTERYIVFCFVLYCAPVVFATGAFKSTAQIFRSWCRMLASQALLLLLNVWSIKLFLSYLPVLESDRLNIIFNFLIGYAFLKFAQKADTLLRILGLSTASTGDIVRSLGGTATSIALAIRSMGGMAGTVSNAARMFGGGAAAAGAATGGSARAAGGGSVGGMGGAPGSAPTSAGGSPQTGGGGSVTNSGMSAAKQGYVNDVLGSAKSQTGGEEKARGGTDGSQARQYQYMESDSGSLRATSNNTAGGNLGMEHGKHSLPAVQPRVDAETREGLANIAHGLPHDKYNPVKGVWSGGGFPEFTGENANLIGASELTPAEGFRQQGVKMRDGSVGTLYQNGETGAAHLVQFGSVDNGVIQGVISEVDQKTGQPGDFMAFKAVHQSVPGAESFSGHSVPVADGAGGIYHLSTGADTTFFASGGNSVAEATTRTPSTATAQRASVPITGDSVLATGIVVGGMGEVSARHTPASSHETSAVPTSEMAHVDSVASSAPDISGAALVGSDLSDSKTKAPTSHDSGHLPGLNAEIPPADTGARQQPHSMPSRFSRSNPANMEVFRREGGGAESFSRAPQISDQVPQMGSSDDKKHRKADSK